MLGSSYELGMASLTVSGGSFIMVKVYNFKILNRMDRAVKIYNEWLLVELGLRGRKPNPD